jgi:hypothetical protein
MVGAVREQPLLRQTHFYVAGSEKSILDFIFLMISDRKNIQAEKLLRRDLGWKRLNV